MAYEIPGQMIPLDSGSTAVAQFYAVGLSTAGVILTASTADVQFIGIAQNGNDSTTVGESINVMINGVSKLHAASNTLTAGDAFGVNAAGVAIPLAGNATQKGIVVAGTSAAADRVISVLIMPIA